MDMYLYIYIMGLVALVPSADDSSLVIVLQQARTTTEHRHVPVLVYPCADVAEPPPSCAQRDAEAVARELNVLDNWDEGTRWLRRLLETKRRTRSSQTFGAVLLDGVRISIEGAAKEEEGERYRLEFARDKRVDRMLDSFGAAPASAEEVKDFSWVPSLRPIKRSSAVLEQRHLYAPSSREVAAVVKLEGVDGEVETFRVASLCRRQGANGGIHTATPCFLQGEEEVLPTLTFGKPGLNLRQAVGDVVLVKVRLESAVKLKLTALADADAERTDIEIVPQPGDGRIEILLGNLPPLSTDTSHPLAIHFDLYRRLSERPWAAELGNPHLGSEMRWREAEGVNPPMPEVIRVVSEVESFAGGFSRPVCMGLVFDSP